MGVWGEWARGTSVPCISGPQASANRGILSELESVAQNVPRNGVVGSRSPSESRPLDEVSSEGSVSFVSQT
jgi:hypothetical protein